MKKYRLLTFKTILFLLSVTIFQVNAQAPQKLNYQAVVFDNQNALVRNSSIGLRISILSNSPEGEIVYQETYVPNPLTNNNGVITVEVGNGSPVIGAFDQIDWSTGVYFIKSETDLTGGSNYTISGTSQILSAPYALYAERSGDGFSGNYEDLTNKPVIDGTETKIVAGNGISLSGAGSVTDPYQVSTLPMQPMLTPLVITASEIFTVPQGVSKIRVELWGASGGGGGSGAYTYSYYLQAGGDGGGGGYAQQDLDVVPGQQIDITIGSGGEPGNNAIYVSGNYIGDTDGGDGGDSYLGLMVADGGKGGKKGSYSYYTVHGLPGTENTGAITAHPSEGARNTLDVYYGLARSYIADRKYTSKPGTGGYTYSYSMPTAGEGGCAIITFIGQ